MGNAEGKDEVGIVGGVYREGQGWEGWILLRGQRLQRKRKQEQG